VPSLTEEAVFRWPVARWPSALGAGASLAAFAAWHPLGGLMLPEARPVLWDPGFLALALGLGVACTASAWRAGTIWPAVAIHWAVVAAWTLLWGGPTFLR
jgi:predicted Abi (CAAX) family protease